jgi:predicted nucleic acid-binding protein
MMMPDVNVLVAASDRAHVFHTRARAWLQQNSPVATCALTELGMVRILIRLGTSIKDAEEQLAFLAANFRGAFIHCDFSVEALKGKISGHRQITDKYLVELCAKHSLQLATFDKSISGAHLVA